MLKSHKKNSLFSENLRVVSHWWNVKWAGPDQEGALMLSHFRNDFWESNFGP